MSSVRFCANSKGAFNNIRRHGETIPLSRKMTSDDIRRQAYLEIKDSVKKFGKHAKRSLKGFIAKHLEPMFRWGSHLFSVAATVAAERCLADIANTEQLLAIRA